MSLASDIAVLRRVPFFERFDDEHLRLLAFGGENLRHGEGDVLFRVGDATDGGHVILSGQIRLTRDAQDDPGERFKVATLLGQRALLVPTVRRHTAIAATRCETLLIRRSLFVRMLSEFPNLAAELHAEMADELRLLTDRASSVVTRNRT